MFKALSLVTLLTFATATSSSAHVIPFKSDIKEVVGIIPYAKVYDEKQIKCLADNIYYEAGNQKDIGMKAVAFATINRLNHEAFPDTICEVVHQKIANVCQFSWVCNKNRRVKDFYAYYRSKRMAKLVLANYKYMYDVTKGATFFHRNDVWPGWANPKKRTVIIGKHLFYAL